MQPARPWLTLRGGGTAELEIKRSRFLGLAAPAPDERAVHDALTQRRSAHPDASHHCFAYRLGTGGESGRFSDDGEPGGAAGRPIMEVLLRENVVDVVVLVTRYFGGTLLGSGGLARAYSQAASEAVRAAGLLEMRPYTALRITVDYAHLGAVEQALLRAGRTDDDREFAERVALSVPVPLGEERLWATIVADITAGTGTAVPGPTIYLPETVVRGEAPHGSGT